MDTFYQISLKNKNNKTMDFRYSVESPCNLITSVRLLAINDIPCGPEKIYTLPYNVYSSLITRLTKEYKSASF